MDSTVMTQRSQIDSNKYPIRLAAVERLRLGRAEAVKGTLATAGLLPQLE